MKKKFVFCLKWLLLLVLTGLCAGALGALFSLAVSLVTDFRLKHSAVLYFLPLGGFLSVFIYSRLKTTGLGTTDALAGATGEKPVSLRLLPSVFCGTVLTHLFGGSAGREGAALQMGSALSTGLARLFRLTEDRRQILAVAGMGAVFSALFGTPLGAAVFALEVVCTGRKLLRALVPVFGASLVAFYTARLLGAESERFSVRSFPALSARTAACLCIIGVGGAVVSWLFCQALHRGEKLFETWFHNPYLRIAVGGLLIVLLTVIEGSHYYNGGGLDVVARLFTKAQAIPWAFLLKLVFTVFTISAGFKGGEVVPTLFIGAFFGSSVAALLTVPVGFGAMVGMGVLLACATKCPVASLIICCEMFGLKSFPACLFAILIGFLISGKTGLYSVKANLYSFLYPCQKQEKPSVEPEPCPEAVTK